MPREHATNPRAVALGVALFALIVAARPAAADERPVLVLDAVGDAESAAVVERVERYLGPDPALDPVPQRFREALRQPTFTDTSWTAARDVLVEVRRLLTPAGYREAAQRARDAQDALARFAGEPEPRALLADLVLVEGLAVAGESGVDAARPLFALVHRLRPGSKLDPARYLPDVVRAFDAAAVSGASGRLDIDATGAEQVLIDGVPVVGEDRVTVSVAAGPHIVTVRGESIDAEGRRIEAIAAQEVVVRLTPVAARLEVRLGRARDRLVAATDDRARMDAVHSLLGLTRVAHAVVIVRAEGPERALAARLYTGVGGLGPPRELGDDLAGAVAPLRPVVVKPRPGGPPPGGRVPGGPPTPPIPAPTPWWRTTWFKATSGTVGGLLAAVIVTAIVTRDPGSSTFQTGVEVE